MPTLWGNTLVPLSKAAGIQDSQRFRAKGSGIWFSLKCLQFIVRARDEICPSSINEVRASAFPEAEGSGSLKSLYSFPVPHFAANPPTAFREVRDFVRVVPGKSGRMFTA
jgi:hypothetical protein